MFTRLFSLLFIGLFWNDLLKAQATSVIDGRFKVLVDKYGYVYGKVVAEWTSELQIVVQLRDLEILFDNKLTLMVEMNKVVTPATNPPTPVVAAKKCDIKGNTAKCIVIVTADLIKDAKGDIVVYFASDETVGVPRYKIYSLAYDKTTKFTATKCNADSTEEIKNQCICPLIKDPDSTCDDVSKPEFASKQGLIESDDLPLNVQTMQFNLATGTFDQSARTTIYLYNEVKGFSTFTYEKLIAGGITDDKPFYLKVKFGQFPTDIKLDDKYKNNKLAINFDTKPVLLFDNARCIKKSDIITCYCCDQKSGDMPEQCTKDGLKITTTTSSTTTSTQEPTTTTVFTTTSVTTTVPKQKTTTANSANGQVINFFWILVFSLGFYLL